MALYKAAGYVAMKHPDTRGTSVSHTSASTVLTLPWKFVDDILCHVIFNSPIVLPASSQFYVANSPIDTSNTLCISAENE